MRIGVIDFSSIITDESLQEAVWGDRYAQAMRDPANSRRLLISVLAQNTLALNQEEILRVIQNVGAGDTLQSLRKDWLWEIQHYATADRDRSARSSEQIARIITACSGALESIYVRENGQGDGLIKAHLSMAARYLKGDFVKKNEARGMELLRPLIDQDNPEAQGVLGAHLLCKGSGRDRARALDLLERASAHGSVLAMSTLAKEYMGNLEFDERERVLGCNGTRIAEGIPHLIRAAAAGDPWSMQRLGHMSLSGACVPQDIREGVRLLSNLPQLWKDMFEAEELHLSRFKAQD